MRRRGLRGATTVVVRREIRGRMMMHHLMGRAGQGHCRRGKREQHKSRYGQEREQATYARNEVHWRSIPEGSANENMNYSNEDRMLEEAGHFALILINQRIRHLEVRLIIRGMHLLLKQEHAEYLDSAQKPISWRLSIRNA
jgi:hypothetical protein